MKRSSRGEITVDSATRATAADAADAVDAEQTGRREATDQTPRTRDLRGFWRRALAILVPVPMLALVAQLIMLPFPIGGNFGRAIAGAAANPGAAQAALWCSLIFALTVAPATMAVAWTGRRGAPRLTLAAGVSLLVAFGAGLPNTALAAVSAATHGLDPALASAINSAVAGHPVSGVGTAIFLLGQTVGFVLLGIALWRARVLPAWLATVLAASAPAHIVLTSWNAAIALTWAMTAIGYVGAAVALWRTRNSDFDLPPTGREAAALTAADGATMSRRGDARTGWRWLLAIAAVPVPIFVAVFRYLLPYDGADTPQEIFAKLVATPTFQNVAIWLGIAVGMCGFAGALAVAWLTRRRTPVLTTIAMALAVPGYLALFASGTYGDLLSLVTRTVPGLDYQTAFQLGSGMESSPQSGAQGLIFVAGHLFGTTLLGIALWRARIAPTWLAIGLTVSQPIHLISVMTDVRPLDLVGWGLTAVGFAWAAWRLAKLSNDEFDLPPSDRPRSR